MSINVNHVTDTETPTTGNLNVAGIMTLPNASGNGIKVNNASPAFGWQDLIGAITAKTSGVTAAPFNTFRNNILAYQMDNSTRAFYIIYHVPHDYVPGTDIFWHVHWAHNSASVTTGSVTWQYEATYAKGFNQAPFPASVVGTVTQAASTVQYQHMVAEGQMSVAGGSGTQLNSTNFEVDGLILLVATLSANTMSAATDPFIFTADIHYQSTGISTKNKAPNFYT